MEGDPPDRLKHATRRYASCQACGSWNTRRGAKLCHVCRSKSRGASGPLFGFRRRTGISFAELARRVGVSEKTVNNWARGSAFPGHVRLSRLAEAMGRECVELYAELAKGFDLGDVKEDGTRGKAGEGVSGRGSPWGEGGSTSAWGRAKDNWSMAKKAREK